MSTDQRPTVRTVTDEQLFSWGFVTEITDHCVGSKVIVRAGMQRRDAVHAAWAAGHVRMAVPAAPAGDRTWADENPAQRPARPDAAVTAWAASFSKVSA